jgi:DNA/RNA-binding domain of Phe-tRNA-synthetase-like protein
MPRIHPLIDLCNAVSMAFATPVRPWIWRRSGTWLQVRPAEGSERYLAFGAPSSSTPSRAR